MTTAHVVTHIEDIDRQLRAVCRLLEYAQNDYQRDRVLKRLDLLLQDRFALQTGGSN